MCLQTVDETVAFAASDAASAKAWVDEITGILTNRGVEASVKAYLDGLPGDPARAGAPSPPATSYSLSSAGVEQPCTIASH